MTSLTENLPFIRMSVGNIAVLVGIIITGATAWVTAEDQIDTNATGLLRIERTLETEQAKSRITRGLVDERLRNLELDGARKDEKFNSMLNSLTRIERTLETIGSSLIEP